MDGRRLDLNLLVTLEALLAEQNVTRAAERLHLSQPAVSAQLARLRDVFDDPLLTPVQRGMVPTARAVELREPLRAALEAVRRAVDDHRAFDPAEAAMTVHLACTDYLQVAVVTPLVTALRSDAPGLRVALRVLDARQLDTQMSRGDVDLALMQPRTTPARLRHRPLFDDDYVLIARAGHPRLSGGPASARVLATLDHVVVSPKGGGFRTDADVAFEALGMRRRVVLSAASFLFVPDLVAHSDLVALVPRRLVEGRERDLQVQPCPFPLAGFTIGLVWHERTHAHPAHRWLRERIVRLVGDTSAPPSAAPAR